MGEGELFLETLLDIGRLSIGDDVGILTGNIFNTRLLSDCCSTDLTGADIGLTLFVWTGLLNPNDDT